MDITINIGTSENIIIAKLLRLIIINKVSKSDDGYRYYTVNLKINITPEELSAIYKIMIKMGYRLPSN